jgi:hypothetical protein
MLDLSKIYIYRITHIENIKHILQYGITHSTSLNANPDFVPIGDGSLISSRSSFLLNNGRKLGEYIPFYFCIRSPMLYVIQNGFNHVAPIHAENLVYCVSSVQKIMDLNLDFVFTDGHAVNSLSSQYSKSDVDNIVNIIDISAIKSKYWKNENDLDLKRRKEAEFLVLGDIASSAILGYIVYNTNSKNKLMSLTNIQSNVFVKQKYYF